MHCEEAQPLLMDLHLGALDAAQLPELEQHIAECELCRGDLANIRMMDSLVDTWEEQNPPLWNPRSLLPPKRGFSQIGREWLPVAATFLIAIGFIATQGISQPTESPDNSLAALSARSLPAPSSEFTPQLVSNRSGSDSFSLGNRPVTHAELSNVLAELRAEHARDREVFAQRVLAVADNRREKDFSTVMRLLRNGPDPSPDEMQRLLRWPEDDPLVGPDFDARVQTVGTGSSAP